MSGDLVVRAGNEVVVIRGGVVVAERAAPDLHVLEWDDGCIVAGFVDLQCNGAGGIDLTAEPERLWEVAGLLLAHGVTGWLPTIVTSPPDRAERAMAALADRPTDLGPVAEPLGLHLEGPFLQPGRRGAHDAALLLEPVAGAERVASWSRGSGVTLVTLAPELHGAIDLVRALAERGVLVAAGHTDATVEQMAAAVDAGVSMVTHLFNAMSPLHHRAPGVPGAALLDDRLRAGVIADGVHLHPATVALAWRALDERFVLVTDGVATMGTSSESASRLTDGTLAGSTTGMDQAVRNLVAFTDCELADAAGAASRAPAAVLGDTTRGHLLPGARGDLVVLDPDGTIRATVVGGRVARGTGAGQRPR